MKESTNYSISNLSNFRYIPRWAVLGIDVSILLISLFVAKIVFKTSSIPVSFGLSFGKELLIIVGINTLLMVLFRTNTGIIRHFTFVDIFRIFLVNTATFLTLFIANYIYLENTGKMLFFIPFLVLYILISFSLLFLFRYSIKTLFYIFANKEKNNYSKKRILILGIDEEAVSVANAIIGSAALPYTLAGFLSRRKDVKRINLLGKEILSVDRLIKEKDELNIYGVLINKYQLEKEELEYWVNLFLDNNLKVLKTPTIQKMRDFDSSIRIENIDIEDLLNRKPISIENDKIKKKNHRKNILVTGGAGSIGSEIVRQLASFEPALLVVLDQAETPLYEIELEMKEKFPNVHFKFILADIANKTRMESIFREYNFSMVYHVAAYKHVPLIEENPHEAIYTNVRGTKSLALLASQYQVDSFVMISTDKAVNPTNVMGASKRAAELFVQALQNKEGNTTRFITTRFGNVLGSNGSVIPLFRKQIQRGGPVTITSPDIVRYFMLIREACELVLQAGTMGKGGEVFVFDMGEPVKILNLATRMIKLSGLEPNVDIKIVYTGLRPGEKLYEELLSDDTRTLPTHHEKIMISKDPTMPFEQINQLTDQIIQTAEGNDKMKVVAILKEIVKEFKSNNSIFSQLDK